MKPLAATSLIIAFSALLSSCTESSSDSNEVSDSESSTSADIVSGDDEDTVTSSDMASFSCDDLEGTFAQVSDLVTYNCDELYLNISSETGLPPTLDVTSDERIMVGISSWIQRVAVPYAYDWKVPLSPGWSEIATEASSKGPIAVAIDGVPIFHYERRPDVSTALSNYTAENDTVVAGELDQCGGHAGQGDDYHYHYAPVCLMDDHDLTKPIAFGLDGAPVYFGQAGTDYYGGGRFNTLNNFPEGIDASDLDECNALLQDDGSYVHYSTNTPPYLIGCHHAEFDTALQIEPSPMNGREQGTETPLGGQYGEPVSTMITGFSDDGNGQYTLTFNALDGSDQTSSIIYSKASQAATETCWNFEFRTDENQAGEIHTACREDTQSSTASIESGFTHGDEY